MEWWVWVIVGLLVGMGIFSLGQLPSMHRHTWTRWTDYDRRIEGAEEEGKRGSDVERRQTRECESCGKRQDRWWSYVGKTEEKER